MKTCLLQRARLAVAALLLWAPVQAAFAQNFSLYIQNTNALLLVPGTSISFIINLSSVDGFSTNVTLSVGTLPTGVTAAFSPNPVKVTPSADLLPTTSVLTLTAASTIQAGSFPVDITAIGGGITNTTSSSVSVQFGLVPNCYGAFVGQATDSVTGLPVPGAIVTASYSAEVGSTTDSNGLYSFTNLALANNNATTYQLQAVASNYYYTPFISGEAVCDGTNIVNLQLVRILHGSMSGHVSVQGGGPAAGVTVQIQGENVAGGTNAVTDANGNYSAPVLGLGNLNASGNYSVTVDQPGDWEAHQQADVNANMNTVVNLILVPICYGSVTGTVLYGDTHLPATNLQVFIPGGLFYVYGTTDANGNYTLTNVALGDLNTTLNTYVQAGGNPAYYSALTNVSLTTCGATVPVPIIYLQPLPKTNYGSVTGHVYDVQTGLPLANADVSGVTSTGADGSYLYSNIMIGTGATTNEPGYPLTASATGYFSAFTNITLYSGVTVSQDFYLLRIGYGYIMGTVRDSATTLPLTNVYVSASGGSSTYTDSNGNYSTGPIQLSTGNLPTTISVGTAPSGYYVFSATTKITNGVTNVLNLFPIKICTGATIVGTVVNAVTQQPITNATVYVTGYPSHFTDTNGNFILTNITVGNNNSPILTTVNATAPGFNPQSHNVTIFCDATITTEFGAPQTAFGTIQGYVTNAISGSPLYGVFIGSEFGEATMTDSNGFYQLTQAPLGANNSSRTWTVTAVPTNFIGQTLSVTVSSNAISTLNFGFGMPPTHLLVTDSSTTNVTTVGSNLVYTIMLTNNGADAANVVLSDQLATTLTFMSATISNTPDGAFTAPVYSNGVVTTTATNLASGEALSLVITTTPTAPGSIVNSTIVTSSTPDTDLTGASRTAAVTNTAAAANLAISISATTNVITVGSNLVYDITVTNSGVDAGNVLLSDQLPQNVTFVGASIVNPPGGLFASPVFANGIVTTTGPTLASGSSLVLVVTVTPTIAGALTNVTTVTTGTAEVNPGISRTAMLVTTAVAPVVLPANLAVAITATTNVVTVGNNLVYDVTLSNSGAVATNVVLSDQLPPAVTFVNASVINPPGGLFTAPVFASGIVTTTGSSLASGASLVLAVTVTPTMAGTLTNITTATTASAEVNPGISRTAMLVTAAIAPVVLPANLTVAITSTTNVVTVGSNLVYDVTLTNSGAAATNVVLSDQLPPTVTFINASVINPPGGLFTAPVFSNRVITTTGPSLASGASLVLVVTVIPTASGVLTNITTATSSTPEANPGTNNLTAMVINTAAAPQVLNADIGLTVTATPNPVVVSNQLTYLVSVTNFGPADAPGVVLDDVLPTNSTFISASNSQGSFTQNGNALHWGLGMITNGGNAEITFVITPLVVGLVTNSATTGVGGGVIDLNQTNNTASVVVTVNAPAQIIPPNVSLIAGAITFDPQTGLFEQSLQFNNLGASAATGVRVAVLGLPATVTLYNASGSTNGVPYVEYDDAIPANGTVNFALEYYSTTRLPFVSTNFVATVLAPVVPALPTGTTVALDQMPTLNNGQFLIEFPSTPGATYVIEYSTNLTTWQTAVPPIVATASRVQWIDAGPPKTVSAPGAVGSRLYRVLQLGSTNSPNN